MTEATEVTEVAELQEQLKPLFDNLNELTAKEEELVEQLVGIKGAKKRIEKILRAGGLLDPYRPNAVAARNGKRPEAEKRQSQVSDEMVALILTAAEKVAKKRDEWTIREVAEEGGKDLATTKRCLEIMRADHVVRLVGKKYPGHGPAHVRAVHYAMMEN